MDLWILHNMDKIFQYSQVPSLEAIQTDLQNNIEKFDRLHKKNSFDPLRMYLIFFYG